MSFVNFEKREIQARVVYYGAPGAGKTTNLRYLFEKTASPGAQVHAEAAGVPSGERIDFLPMQMGAIAGFRTSFDLYTAPSAPVLGDARRRVLAGVDALVFVVGSQPSEVQPAAAALAELRRDLAANGYALEKMPLVVQYNKRDLAGATPIEALRAAVAAPPGTPEIQAVAVQGVGVFDSLKAVARMVLTELKKAR